MATILSKSRYGWGAYLLSKPVYMWSSLISSLGSQLLFIHQRTEAEGVIVMFDGRQKAGNWIVSVPMISHHHYSLCLLFTSQKQMEL